jgi:NADPH:quinone reductase
VRALVCTALDGPDAVEVRDVGAPSEQHPLTGQPGVLVQVDAAGVAFPDLLITQGRYQMRMEPPFVPGNEVAGTVLSAPEGSGFGEGDRVMAFCAVGGLAEQAVGLPFMTFALPDELDAAEGCGIILNYHTAWFCLVTRGQVREGETVLVHGAAGGVGTAALQVCRGLGVRTIAVVSSDAKERAARDAGADEVVRADADWRSAVQELTDGRGVDVVYDPVGGDRFLDSLRSLARGGRLVVVGFTGGSIPEVKVNRLLLRNTSVVGAAWGEWALSTPALNAEIDAGLRPLIASGAVKPLLGARFSFEHGADALRALDRREAVGKLVVEIV